MDEIGRDRYEGAGASASTGNGVVEEHAERLTVPDGANRGEAIAAEFVKDLSAFLEKRGTQVLGIAGVVCYMPTQEDIDRMPDGVRADVLEQIAKRDGKLPGMFQWMGAGDPSWVLHAVVTGAEEFGNQVRETMVEDALRHMYGEGK